jgi:hypothetical protein
MARFGQSLDAMVGCTQQLKQVRKEDLRPGDWVIVATLNSVYSIRVHDSGFYLVSGGWFDRKGLSPVRTTITGCTWGGSAIKLDVVAACGLCLEFGNRVVTSIIRKVVVLPWGSEN